MAKTIKKKTAAKPKKLLKTTKVVVKLGKIGRAHV
jgi:hypothetical protein